MIKITEVQGDIFDKKNAIIVHGCNAMGVMGKGVAGQVKLMYPGAFQVYREAFSKAVSEGVSNLELGNITAYKKTSDAGWIINMVTQMDYKRAGNEPGQLFSTYGLIKGFQELNKFLRVIDPAGNLPIVVPRIGAGLGGGDWDHIRPIIEASVNDRELFIYTL